MSGTPTIPFDATSTADEVLAGVDQAGRRIVVTGANSGLGAETSRALAAAGAEVTLAARDTVAAAAVREQIVSTTGNTTVGVEQLDLADPASVAAFAARWRGPLHALVANAGVMATPRRHTAHGWELQFATNHLGHFQLATALRPALAEVRGARVVVVSSVGHVNGGVLFDDIHFATHPYDPWVAYSQSKTANVLFAVEAAERWAPHSITVNALNPGRIRETALARYSETPPSAFDPAGVTGVSVKTIAQGAATSVLLAASPLVEGVTGTYFEDCRPAGAYVAGTRRGVAAHAVDADAAGRLWTVSAEMLAAAGYPVS